MTDVVVRAVTILAGGAIMVAVMVGVLSSAKTTGEAFRLGGVAFFIWLACMLLIVWLW